MRDRRVAALWLGISLRRLPQPAHAGMRREILARLAWPMLSFTPTISLEDERCAILLEVGASLHLFDGAAGLRARLLALPDLAACEPVISGAPTARAALWLACAGVETIVTEAVDAGALLARLPVAATGWPPEALRLLAGIGVSTLGQCMRLPRHGLGRRLGPDRLRELDQARGRLAFLPAGYLPRSCFRDTLELPVATNDAALLLQAADRLLERLSAWLLRRQAGVAALWWRLHHARAGASLIRIAPARPGAGMALLRELFGLHLGKASPGATVHALELLAEPDACGEPSAADLLGDLADVPARAAEFVQRLGARLGSEAVYGLAPQASHRPESSWALVRDPLSSGGQPQTLPGSVGLRPLWVLPVPRRLPVRAGRPVCRGALRMESGPERIETGWWDGLHVRRDYYAARDPGGVRLWIFSDLRDACWYLHGLFG